MLKDLTKSFFLYGVASGISRFLLVLLVPLYTTVFSPAEYGIVDLLTGFVALMVVIGMLQMESAIARYYYEVEGEKRRVLISTAFKTVICLSLLFGALLFAASGPVARIVFDREGHEDLIAWGSLWITVSIVFNLLVFLLRFEQKVLHYFVFILLQVVITVAAIVYFVYFNSVTYGLAGVAYGQIAGLSIPAIALLFYFRRDIGARWDKETFGGLMKYATPLIPSVAINWANAWFNRFMMLRFFALTDVGIYSLAVRISSAFALIEVAFNLAWGPIFWKAYADQKNHALFRMVFRHLCVLMFCLVMGGSLLSSEIIALFANDSYQQSSHVLGFVLLAYSLTIFVQLVGMGPAVVKKTVYSLVISLAGLTLNLVVLWVLKDSWGIEGVAMASLAGNAVTVAAFWIVSERLFPLKFSWKFFLLWLFIAAGVAWWMAIAPPALTVRLILLAGLAVFLVAYAVVHFRKWKANFKG
jgi:O-antigen/teichoic acid export membrane protein